MRIYSMTATFGKLENQTLVLEPGLNVIHAPNEWGKSTWCAFLVNMLYGMETRAKSTKTALADKERYAPWSGSRMAGRIDLNWNGRDITVERWTKGRTPMGEFRAYETQGGLAVAELTAANCGQLLLGVERSVFQRSGFIRLADLPVTEDDALRRRLNALVTTGDESGAADVLAQRLKELKNKCRYNRTGLLPVAENEATEAEENLKKIAVFSEKCEENEAQLHALSRHIQALENHQAALEYLAAAENDRRVAQALTQRDAAKDRLEQTEKRCAALPDARQCAASGQRLRRLHQDMLALDMEQGMLPPPPEKPANCGFTAEQAAQDQGALSALQMEKKRAKERKISGFVGCGIGALAAVVGLLLHSSTLIAVSLVLAAVCSVVAVLQAGKEKAVAERLAQLLGKYGALPAEAWVATAQRAGAELTRYEREMAVWEEKQLFLRQRREKLSADILTLTGGEPISECMARWTEAEKAWAELERAKEDYQSAAGHAEALAAMAKPRQKPEGEDLLTDSPERTRQLLAEARERRRLLQQQHDTLLGRMESMGREDVLRRQLETAQRRVSNLNQIYAALELAQATLAAATAELQRRFAPQIARDARDIFQRLTHGRYTKLTIAQDMTLQAGAEDESILYPAQWRSEGTVDQMYLALRMAVSKALIPQAPLVLDDALVRFDDRRHAAATELLAQEAAHRQIILFSCQSRAKP